MRAWLRFAIAVLLPFTVRAHTGAALEPHDFWTSWTFDAGVILPLLLTSFLYARGARRSRGVSISQAVCFWSGWFVLFVSLVSPLHSLGEALFSAHMAQHELLMLGAAPLLVLSRPLVPLLWGLPVSWRRGIGQWAKAGLIQRLWHGMSRPFAAWWIHAAALWVWHAPGLFQATLSSEPVHAAQHVSFLASALLFWWSLFYARGRAGYGLGVLYIFTTAVHTSILGALLTFAPRVWYPAYSGRGAAWGLTALEDQQIGGLIMWVPAGVVYVAAGLALFAAWLQTSELRSAQRTYAG
jgi:putative membrane protein